MHFAIKTILLTLTTAIVACPVTAADRCKAETNPAAATAQAFLDALRETNQVPGMGAAVWHDGKVVWTGCSGWRDLAAKLPVESDTVFRLASVSKVITATAIAKLVEQGKLNLDDPVQHMLPWLKNDWPEMSVRQLAAHASGLPHYRLGDQNVGLKHYADGRAAVGIFSDRSLLAAPGQNYFYSSWGYTLIGAVIEAQSGQHVLDFVRQQISAGLDIDGDGLASPERRSRLYELRNNQAHAIKARDFSYTWTGGGFAATPEALVRFAARLMQGDIVSTQSWKMMRQAFVLHSGAYAGERDYQVGLGWRIGQDQGGAPIVHHSGVTDGARSSLVLWPEEHTAASVLSNAQWISSIEKTAIMLAAPFRTPPSNLVSAQCPTTAVTYFGQLSGKKIRGQAQFRLSHGRCLGTLYADATLRKHFASASAWPSGTLQLVGFGPQLEFSRAAFVTPFGLYEMRARADKRYSVQLGPEQELTLQFGSK